MSYADTEISIIQSGIDDRVWCGVIPGLEIMQIIDTAGGIRACKKETIRIAIARLRLEPGLRHDPSPVARVRRGGRLLRQRPDHVPVGLGAGPGPMSLIAIHSVNCDAALLDMGHGEGCPGWVGEEWSGTEARRVAKSYGWKSIRIDDARYDLAGPCHEAWSKLRVDTG